MEGEEQKPSVCELEEKISHIFSDFLARFEFREIARREENLINRNEDVKAKEEKRRFAKLEELVAMGSRLLVGFQQGLEFFRRPPINKTSELVENIIKANDTKRVKSYVQAGCINTHDGVQNISKLHTCKRALQDHLVEAKCILDELTCLIEDAAAALQTANGDLSRLQNKEFGNWLDQQEDSQDNMVSEAISSSHVEKPEVTDLAAMMAVIYCMLKQDYMMQERIVSSLNLKSSSGELESYCLMWSLRPYINDEIIHRAWKLIP